MISISTLTSADVGRDVVYTPTGEYGKITSWSNHLIYVVSVRPEPY
jgi:hypothetical protein